MPDVSLAGLLLRLAVSMTVVIGLMLLAARMLRRSASGMGIGGGSRGGRDRRVTIDVAALQHLTKTAHVAVVHAAGREMVVGVTEHQVTLLYSAPQHGLDAEDELVADFDLSADDPSRITGSSSTWLSSDTSVASNTSLPSDTSMPSDPPSNSEPSTSARIAIEDPADAATADGAGQSAWTDALKSLRERTVRR